MRTSLERAWLQRTLAALVLLLVLPLPEARGSYLHFESDPVRPLAISRDGRRLFVTNTSDNRLEILRITAAGLEQESAVFTGLEPVAVAVRGDDEVWVVNHLSDSVSVVDVRATPRVVRTLLVGDEPRDLLFAGRDGTRAFLTTARRGQNIPVDAALATASTPRALLWMYETANAGTSAGTPAQVLELFGDTPRALAASPDGGTVFAAIFHSGNQTVALGEPLVTPIVDALRASVPQIVLGPATNVDGIVAPPTGRIVRFDPATGEFRDVNGIPWTPFFPFSLPDLDVFEIDAHAATPALRRSHAHVGTVLFNMAVNPVTGLLYVSNGDARNEVRFEGTGILGGSTVRGRLSEYRISVIDPASGTLDAVHLNNHIDYRLDPASAASRGFAAHSLATPTQMAVSPDGERLWVAALGSGKVASLATRQLASSRFQANSADHVDITGGGPAGVVHDVARRRLYVYSRFANSVSVVDVSTTPGRELAVVPLSYNVEPASVRTGRRFLYDARLGSANGEASCSSCHVFGRTDDLAWDLGDPDASVLANNNVQAFVPLDQLRAFLGTAGLPRGFSLEHHPMKGPMLTQNLRGMANQGPMHWRGDRSGGRMRDDPASGDEVSAFLAFAGAFRSLLGSTSTPSDEQMRTFAEFVLQVPYPPNPVRELDDSLTPAQANGRRLFAEVRTASPDALGVPQQTCADCHVLDVAAGHFGTDGRTTFDGLPQMFKIPHLRHLVDRVGMFGEFGLPESLVPVGAQVRGYGFQNDGFVSSLFTFLGDETRGGVFRFPGDAAQRLAARRDLEAFLLAFDTELLPIVGQQVTLDATGPAARLLAHRQDSVGDRIALLRAQARIRVPRPACDLVVKGTIAGVPRGWLMTDVGDYLDDRGDRIGHEALAALANVPGQALTFTCVYPGGGRRMAIDRDDDGIPDGRQCGDVDDDGVAGLADARRLRQALVGAGSLRTMAKCNVVDARGEAVSQCTLADVVAIVRARQPGGAVLGQRCSAATT